MSSSTKDSRRLFLQYAAGAGLAGLTAMRSFADEPENCAGPRTPRPIRFRPNLRRPIKPRRPASTLNATEVQELRAAYTALRKLTQTDPKDPRGWLQQGDKHCWNCGGGLDGQAGEEIHGSWLFFPWHRAYLYFHERILGTLSNNDNLRLAYWDWDNPQHRAVPPAWVTPNNAGNSLFDANRSAQAGDQAPNSIVGPQVMNQVMGSPDFASFGGTANSAGALE